MDLRSASICSLLLVLAFTLPSESVRVEIFYETVNEVVRQFFVEQFTPEFFKAHQSRGAGLTIALYPYGNTTQLDSGHYTCPYGNLQCQANKVHVCFIQAETPEDPPDEHIDPIKAPKALDFVHCFFRNRRADKSTSTLSKDCMPPEYRPDWELVNSCSSQEDSISEHFAALTKQVAAQIKEDGLVVRIDGKVAEQDNFTMVICAMLKSTDATCKNSEPKKKLQLAVFYEALSADSAAYIAKQLATYYHIIEDYVDVDLVPFGSTVLDAKTGTVKCTLGEAQCISNKYQAFVVHEYMHKVKNGDLVTGPRRAINFASCILQSNIGNVFSALEMCSNTMLKSGEYKIFIEQVKSNSATLKSALTEMNTKTQKVATKGVLPRVPTVTIGGKVNYAALDDLLGTICNSVPALKKAKACAKTNVTVLYEPLNHRTRTFFLEQLNPVFSNLHGLINLQLLPGGRTISVPGSELTCPGVDRTHRVDHCNAMKLQACVLDYFWHDGFNYTDPVRREIFDYIVCTLKNKKMLSVAEVAERCAEKYIDPKAWATIKKDCSGKPAGETVLRGYIDETRRLLTALTTVENRQFPIVLIDGQPLQELNTLKTRLCSLHDKDFQFCLDTAVHEKISIEVYYEAQEEHSKRFITTQYAQWFAYFEEMASVRLLPAGNQNVKPAEHTDGSCVSYDRNSACVANKLEALVIDKYSKENDEGDSIGGSMRTMLFLNCLSSQANFSKDIYMTAEDCLTKTLPSEKWFDLQTLLTSIDGDTVYKSVLEATHNFKEANALDKGFPVLPWVTLGLSTTGNKHSQRATGDLLQAVCSKFTGEKPTECIPTQMEIYYSALDAPFAKFFTAQLRPVFHSLRERVHLELYPFGIPKAGNTVDQDCKGKENACLHNRIHACALNRFFKDEVLDDSPIAWDGKNQTLEMIHCMLDGVKETNVPKLMEKCAKQQGIALDVLKACVDGLEGKRFLESVRTKTLTLFEPMKTSPWIVINGLHTPTAEADLAKMLCTNMIGDKHEFCYHPDARFVTTKKPATKATTKKATPKPAVTTKKPTSNKPVTSPPATKKPTVSSYTVVDILIIIAVGILGVLIGIGATALIASHCAKARRGSSKTA